MFRWGLILIGLFFLWGGIDNHFNYSSNINETALEVNFSKLEEIIRGNKKTFIRFQGSLDSTGRVYRSYIKQPPYSGFAARDIQSLTLSDLNNPETAKRNMGAQVEVERRLEAGYIEVQWIREKENERELQGASLIAPIAGTNYNVWSLSPFFRSSDTEKKNAWLSKNIQSGRLSRFSDLSTNASNLTKSFLEVSQIFSKTQGQFIPSNALLLLDHRPLMLEVDVPREKFYALVEETDLKLYAEINEAKSLEIERTGEIIGILEPKNSRVYSDFKRVLAEEEFPDRIGVVTSGSGKESNDKDFQVTMIGVIGGLLMLALGGYLLLKEKS